MLRNRLSILGVASLMFFSCKTGSLNTSKSNDVVTSIDLINIVDDKVKVEINPGKLKTETTTFRIPKTVPGTYSSDNYGKYIEAVKAFDYKGNEMTTNKVDENSWLIPNAKNLDKVTYLVNDTYDSEATVTEGKPVFSPAGSNIQKDKNYMLNLHAFVGYFDSEIQNKYQINIMRPTTMEGVTSLPKTVKENDGFKTDTFTASRYAEVTDSPIMYTTPDIASFMVNDMKITLSVYSPNKVYTAASLKDGVEKMITAQKRFLGDIDGTKQYNILLYLSSLQKDDAQGFGALEHNTSTVVVLPEAMPADAIAKAITDVVSHEFFHIVTPLSIHSEEIHYFNYNNPKMSKHLWMYEGVTEYFANLFQINQGLIDEEAFYARINDKISNSKHFDDTMSFTEMSANILKEPYKANYANVYEKGALIGMLIDLKLREASNGKTGILDLMKKLSKEYGSEKPFKDEELIDKIISFTTPELKPVIDTYIVGNTPIPYADILTKVGLEMKQTEVPTGYLLNGQIPYISAEQATKDVFFIDGELNSFLTGLGIESGDIIKNINGTAYNLDNVYEMLSTSYTWNEGDDITFVISRDGIEKTFKGKVTKPMGKSSSIVAKDLPETSKEVQLRNAWLKG